MVFSITIIHESHITFTLKVTFKILGGSLTNSQVDVLQSVKDHLQRSVKNLTMHNATGDSAGTLTMVDNVIMVGLGPKCGSSCGHKGGPEATADTIAEAL